MSKRVQRQSVMGGRFALLCFALLSTTVPYLMAAPDAAFNRVLSMGPAEPVVLDIALPKGDLRIRYNRNGQVSIAATASAPNGKEIDSDFFDDMLVIQQDKNHLQIRWAPKPEYPEEALRIAYEIQVPYWTEIKSKVEQGSQTIAGVMGPVDVWSGNGNLAATFITKDFYGKTGSGDISCNRVFGAAQVETESGNILLKAVGPSAAAVKNGPGRIEANGISGSFTGSTDKGDLKIKGLPYEAWDLRSISGDIHLELSDSAQANLSAATATGQISVKDMELESPRAGSREYHQKLNGGGKSIQVTSDSGNIIVERPGKST